MIHSTRHCQSIFRLFLRNSIKFRWNKWFKDFAFFSVLFERRHDWYKVILNVGLIYDIWSICLDNCDCLCYLLKRDCLTVCRCGGRILDGSFFDLSFIWKQGEEDLKGESFRDENPLEVEGGFGPSGSKITENYRFGMEIHKNRFWSWKTLTAPITNRLIIFASRMTDIKSPQHIKSAT